MSLENYTLNYVPIFADNKEKVLWTPSDVNLNWFYRIMIIVYYAIVVFFILFWFYTSKINFPKDVEKLSEDTPLGNYLHRKHMRGFKNYDEKIIYSILNGNNTITEITASLQIDKKYIKIRIEFMKFRDVIIKDEPLELNPNLIKFLKNFT